MAPRRSSKPISAAIAKPQPIPWTHQETIHLIQAYQEKWYSLQRGQLKSTQWQELAFTVAARCGYNAFEPSKTSIQCRHKMEKLRQRYRAETQRISRGGASDWQYFDPMSNLLRGPPPIAARPMSSVPHENEDEEQAAEKSDTDAEEDVKNRSKSRSISNILEGEMIVNVEEGERGRGMYWKLAAEIRLFGERMMGMEDMKMEMMKETERRRMAMESKRMEMILQSEQKIVNSIARAFGSAKRLKIGQQI